MNKLTLLTIMVFAIVLNCFSQYSCGTLMSSSPNGRFGLDIPDWATFTPNTNTPTRVLRLNFHFILNDDGSGNFTETTDGNGNSNYNGYMYISDLLAYAKASSNNKSNFSMPPNNTLPNLPVKIEYIVEGIYFHRSTAFYLSIDPILINQNSGFKINAANSMNVYINEGILSTGVANPWGNERSQIIFNCWSRYVQDLNNTSPGFQRWWAYDLYGKTLDHETGHCLSLGHTMVNAVGQCDIEDFCDDTPTGGQIVNQFGFNPCCAWNGNPAVCSNNLMTSGSNGNALTPCQLGRMHWTILNELPTTRLCSYQNQTLDVTTLGWPQVLYQARTLRIGNPNGNPVILPNGSKATFVGQNEVELRPGFEAQLGSEFEIKIEPACN